MESSQSPAGQCGGVQSTGIYMSYQQTQDI